MNQRLLGIILILLTTASWGGAWVTARAAAHDAPSMWMAVGRFAFAALALLPIAALLGRPIRFRHDKRTWLHLTGMAFTGAIGYNLFFLWGIELAPASDGAVITPGISGFAGALWVWGLDGIKPRRLAVVGGLLTIAGAAIIGLGAYEATGGSDRLVGNLLFFVASIFWGLYTAFGRRMSATIPAAEGVFWATALAVLFWTPVAWYLRGAPQADWAVGAYWNMAYLGLVATAVGFVTWYLAVKQLGADRAGPGLGLVPVFGVVLAVIFLDERLEWTHVFGGLVVIAGIAVSSQRLERVLHIKHRFAASREQVWAALQPFDNLTDWTDDLSACELLEGDRLAVGTTRRNVFTKPQGDITAVTERVTAVGDHSFTYELIGGIGPYPAVQSTWAIVEEAGHAVLSYEARFQSGFTGYVFWALTKRNLRRGLHKMLDGLGRSLA